MKKIKRIFLFVLCILTIPFFCAFAAEDSIVGTEEEEKIGEIEEFVPKESYELMPDFNGGSVVSGALSGNPVEGTYSFLEQAVGFFLKEFKNAVSSSSSILAIIVISAIMNSLSSSFLSSEVARVGSTVCVVCAGSLSLSKMSGFITMGIESIESLTTFTQVMVPTMVTFFIGGGRFTSAGLFQPAIFMTAQITASLIKNLFLPLIYVYLILIITDSVLPEMGISKISGIFKSIFSWGLSLILTIFTAVISIGGSVFESVDNVAVRALKFSVGTFIPVVGKILSDSTDMVIGSSLLLKSAFGILGIVVAVLICAVPILKLASQIAVFKIASAFSEPFSNAGLSKMLSGFSNALVMMLALSASMALIVIISLAIMVKSGGIV